MYSNTYACINSCIDLFITSIYLVVFLFLLWNLMVQSESCAAQPSTVFYGPVLTDVCCSCLKTSKKLPVTFVVYRQEVHQEHVVCHGIHPKYFHLESWKHSPGKEKKNIGRLLNPGFKWLLLLLAWAHV